jgi:hypothetical protein
VSSFKEYQQALDVNALIDGDVDVNHPQHYTAHPSGIEVIEITRLLPGNLSNAVKYVCRHKNKGRPVQDLQKAGWYLRDFYQYGWSQPPFSPNLPKLVSLITRYIIREPEIEVAEFLGLIQLVMVAPDKTSSTLVYDALYKVAGMIHREMGKAEGIVAA